MKTILTKVKLNGKQVTGLAVLVLLSAIGQMMLPSLLAQDDQWRRRGKFQSGDLDPCRNHGCCYRVFLPDQRGFRQNCVRDFYGFCGKTAERSV